MNRNTPVSNINEEICRPSVIPKCDLKSVDFENSEKIWTIIHCKEGKTQYVFFFVLICLFKM